MTRRRCGKGFTYGGPDGKRITDEVCLQRIRSLAIPPAWVDVWICPWPNGHIQATGVDAAGRRQYRYHEEWRRRKDQEKFDRALEFGRALPTLRRRVAADLAKPGLTRRRVLAAGIRLLDVGCFRVGGEEYAEENDTFGVATLQVRHAALRGDTVVFTYKAKGSLKRTVEVNDPDIVRVIRSLLRRERKRTDDLLAWRRGEVWGNARSDHLNAYIKETIGKDFSAKDFRTWSATVRAAAHIACMGEARPGARHRTKARAAVAAEVAQILGNTPAVCRTSYIDPRVFDCFESGDTIARTVSARLLSGPSVPSRVELAVIAMLDASAAAA
jgi:DNA topoisomerase IB